VSTDADDYNDTLGIVDVSDPYHLKHVISILHGVSVIIDKPQSIGISGNYIYIIGSTSNSLEIISLTGGN